MRFSDADITEAVHRELDSLMDEVIFPREWNSEEALLYAIHKLRERADELNALPKMSMELTLLTLTGVKS